MATLKDEMTEYCKIADYVEQQMKDDVMVYSIYNDHDHPQLKYYAAWPNTFQQFRPSASLKELFCDLLELYQLDQDGESQGADCDYLVRFVELIFEEMIALPVYLQTEQRVVPTYPEPPKINNQKLMAGQKLHDPYVLNLKLDWPHMLDILKSSMSSIGQSGTGLQQSSKDSLVSDAKLALERTRQRVEAKFGKPPTQDGVLYRKEKVVGKKRKSDVTTDIQEQGSS